MKYVKEPSYYPLPEEKINIYSHALGLFLSVIALILLIIKAANNGTVSHLVSFSIFGFSLIICSFNLLS